MKSITKRNINEVGFAVTYSEAYRTGYREALAATRHGNIAIPRDAIEAYWEGYCIGSAVAARRQTRTVRAMRNEKTKS